jgi:4-amino-4-deoxy-L-arabinose transferase-like glycosyltransferase
MTEYTFKITPSVLIDQLFNKLNIWYLILLSGIVRFFTMTFPSDGGMIFDEVHYIKASRALLEGLSANGEHPPLVKIIIMYSIKFFGDYWFAWRLPVVIFSLIGTYFFYKIVEHWMDKKYALMATMFLLTDIIFFIHGNIYMLEMPSLAMSLGFVYYYLKGNWKVSSIMMGIAFLCNEKALLVLLGVAIYHVVIHYKIPRDVRTKAITTSLSAILLMSAVGGGGLFMADSIWKPASSTSAIETANIIVSVDNLGNPVSTITTLITKYTYEYINDPITHLFFMFGYFQNMQGAIVTDKSQARPPVSWILPVTDNWNNPPTYFSLGVSVGDKTMTPINYRGWSSFPIWWMTIPILLSCIWFIRDNMSKFIICMIVPLFGFWVYWDLGNNFLPFNHYFLMTIPYICLGIPFFWKKLYPSYADELIMVHLLISVLFFIWAFPVQLIRIM